VASFWQRLGLWERALHQPLGETTFVVVDTELTGLDVRSAPIIALSAVRMRGSQILLGESFYSLVNPERALARDNVLVHRLRGDDLAGQPLIADALTQFAAFVGDDVIVGHFIGIDLGFIQRDAPRYLGRRLSNHWLDTYQAHRWQFLQEQQFLGGYGLQGEDGTESNLFELAKRYRLPVRHAHHALYDALLAAQLWQRLARTLPDFGVKRLGDAIRVAGG